MRFFSTVVPILALVAVAGCGSHKSSVATSAGAAAAPAAAQSTSPMTAASGAASSMASQGAGAMQAAARTPAPIPATLNCGAVKPVWVNLTRKTYHQPGDPFYGKTRRGEYLCPAQAQADGYRPAGGRMMKSKWHHRHHGGGQSSM